MKKRWINVLLAASLVALTAAGCGNTSSDSMESENVDDSSTDSQETANIEEQVKATLTYWDYSANADLESNVILRTAIEQFSLKVNHGEVLGIAGLVGSGRSEFAKVLYGAAKKESGQIFIDGDEVTIKSPEEAIQHGIGLIPEDRRVSFGIPY